MKNNIGLVNHAKMALNQQWGYVWGTFGQKLTEELLRAKIRQYPQGVGNYQTFIRNNWLGRNTADCVGLIKSYVWWRNGRPYYNGSQDINADMMFNRAKVKGNIRTIPEVPGLCVRFRGHIGVYIGNGWVIEAKGTRHGVVKTRLANGAWTHWLECPFIKYDNKPVENKPAPAKPEKEERKPMKVKVSVKEGTKEFEGFEENKRLYVPADSFAEYLGYNVVRDKETLELRIPHNLMVDGEDSKVGTLNVGKGYTFASVRDLSEENKAMSVEYDGDTGRVKLETGTHWAERHFRNLNNNGIPISERRFNDKATVGHAISVVDSLIGKAISLGIMGKMELSKVTASEGQVLALKMAESVGEEGSEELFHIKNLNTKGIEVSTYDVKSIATRGQLFALADKVLEWMLVNKDTKSRTDLKDLFTESLLNLIKSFLGVNSKQKPKTDIKWDNGWGAVHGDSLVKNGVYIEPRPYSTELDRGYMVELFDLFTDTLMGE